MEKEINIRLAEEKAIREAEFIAASESIKLSQELSLRLETSEPNSNKSSRSSSVSFIPKDIDNDEQPINQLDQIDQANGDEDRDLVKKENENDKPEEDNLDREQDKIVEDENNEKDQSQEDASKITDTLEPIIEIKENDYEPHLTKQESKLILNEFRHDSANFKEEQQEINGHSNDSEVTVLRVDDQDLDNNQDSNDELLLITDQESVDIQGCNHKLHQISDYTKSGISFIFEFQKSIIDNCRNNANSINAQLKMSTLDYLDSLHSKLISLAGFHSPDECSICKDFKHQDVPLLN